MGLVMGTGGKETGNWREAPFKRHRRERRLGEFRIAVHLTRKIGARLKEDKEIASKGKKKRKSTGVQCIDDGDEPPRMY